MTPGGRIKVLIVDDSAVVRKILAESLAGFQDIEVVGAAPDPFVARDKILSLKPDVLTLDIEMPRMDGLTFLKKLMHYQPMPVIIISSIAQSSSRAAMEALELGAVEVLAKPGGPYSVGELRHVLAGKIRAAASSRVRKPAAAPQTNGAAAQPKPVKPPASGPAFDPSVVIAIGASTGGTEAIKEVLTRVPANSPGIVITQHIPPVFSNAFANRMNQCSAVEVKEAAEGDKLMAGRALIAPGGYHMLLKKNGSGYYVTLKNGPPVCYQVPAVDVMFASVAECVGSRAVGVLLTGMGADGAQGMLRMKQAGARTIAQDEASCVVFGMPKQAIQLGAADRVVSLLNIPGAMLGMAKF
jgi:two-component system, chemotaxis family, protein-glutamate methylesterase/glutaminase